MLPLPIGTMIKAGAALLVILALAAGAWWIHTKLAEITQLQEDNKVLTADAQTAKDAAAMSDAAAKAIKQSSDEALAAVQSEHDAEQVADAQTSTIEKDFTNALPADLVCPQGKTGAVPPALAIAIDKLFGYSPSAGLHPENDDRKNPGPAGVPTVPVVAHGH